MPTQNVPGYKPRGDKKRKKKKGKTHDKDANSDVVSMQFEAKEVKHEKGFWRRLLERASCFGHNQRYEDKDSRVIFNVENIENNVNYLVDQKNTSTPNNSDSITIINNSF